MKQIHFLYSILLLIQVLFVFVSLFETFTSLEVTLLWVQYIGRSFEHKFIFIRIGGKGALYTQRYIAIRLSFNSDSIINFSRRHLISRRRLYDNSVFTSIFRFGLIHTQSYGSVGFVSSFTEFDCLTGKSS